MKKIFLTSLIILSTGLTACKSGIIIPFNESVQNNQFNAVLFVPKSPEFHIDTSGMGIIAEAGFNKIYKEHIVNTYKTIKISDILRDSWQSKPPVLEKRVTLAIQKVSLSDETTEFIPKAQVENKRAIDYNYVNVTKQIKGDILFEYRIIGWGYHPMQNVGLLQYEASLVDLKNNEIIWRMGKLLDSQYDLGFTGNAKDINPEMIDAKMQELIQKSFRDIEQKLNPQEKQQ